MAEPQRSILHIDMDAFYASVEQRDDPTLLGKPVIVGGLEGRGVVSAASYEARRFGVHSAMPMSQALRCCPQAKVRPGRMQRYVQVSRQIQALFSEYTSLVQPLSLDEAFLDVTDSDQLFGSAETIGRIIKQRIFEETALTASVGVAHNMFLAKLASDLDKPDGFVIVTPENCQATLDPLPVGRLWGVGQVTQKRLLDFRIRTILDLRTTSQAVLEGMVGNQAASLLSLAHGCDYRQVETEQTAKSISSERTFATDIGDPQVLQQVLLEETEGVATRLRRQQLAARTLTLKLRYGDFRTLSRGRTLKQPTQATEVFWQTAQQIFRTWQKQAFAPLRLLGVGLSNFGAPTSQQLELFPDPHQERQSDLDDVVDRIRERYGSQGIHRLG